MIILAFLQNQWFKNPALTKQMYEEHPERRNRYIQAFLFMGCLTGRRLKEALGQDLCDDIIWEEASPQIAGHSAAAFPPDADHIGDAIQKFKPDIVLAFGKIAQDGIRLAAIRNKKFGTAQHVFRPLLGPHPASRNNPMPELLSIKTQIDELMEGISNG